MILTRVEDIHREQMLLREKIEQSSTDTRKYVDARLKELDERVKEREHREITSLKEANATQDTTITELKTKLEALSKWSDGVKAKAAVVLTIVTFVGASAGGLISKFLSG